jgi:hypothetical protein
MSVDLFPAVIELTLKLMTWMIENFSVFTTLQIEPHILQMPAGFLWKQAPASFLTFTLWWLPLAHCILATLVP